MICMYSDINAFAKPSATPYAKRWPRSASGGGFNAHVYTALNWIPA